MKILVNSQPLKGLMTGIGRYVRNLYKCISCMDDIDVQYFDGSCVEATMPSLISANRWIKMTDLAWKLPPPLVFLMRTIMWVKFEYKLSKVIRILNPNVYHETAFTPAAVRNGIFQVFTLHDLSLLHHSSTHPLERVWFFKFFFPRRFKYAHRIIVPSNFIKNELTSVLKISKSRIVVIPEAPDPVFTPISNSKIRKVKEMLGIDGSYVLFVGTMEPRKNLPVLLKAMKLVPKEISLVLAGWSGWGSKDWLENLDVDVCRRIKTTGYISDHILVALYCGAISLVYPSIYEGFGLPVLEAMACGCPVICSQVASLPEVAGDAAIMVNPRNPLEIAKAIINLYKNKDFRNELIGKGFKRVTNFSWKKTAELTVHIMRDDNL